jgi:hypothetical protein
MNEQTEAPWEQPGNVRRDGEPHRREGLQILAWIARVCGLLSFFMCFPAALIGIALGLVVERLCLRDIKKMDAGVMDPRGREQASAASIAAVRGAEWSFWGAGIWLCAGILWQYFFQ